MEVAAYDTADGLYDCAWSEENDNVLIAACGDGSAKVYDVARPPQANPLRSFHEHRHEVGAAPCATAALSPAAAAGSKRA